MKIQCKKTKLYCNENNITFCSSEDWISGIFKNTRVNQVLKYFGNVSYKLVTPDAFGGVVMVSNHTEQ